MEVNALTNTLKQVKICRVSEVKVSRFRKRKPLYYRMFMWLQIAGCSCPRGHNIEIEEMHPMLFESRVVEAL